MAEGALYGGLIGGATGALIGIAPTIGAFVGSAFAGTAGAGSAVAVASTYAITAGATVALGMNLMFMGNPMTPNPNDPSRPHVGTKNGKAKWDQHSKRRSGAPEKKMHE